MCTCAVTTEEVHVSRKGVISMLPSGLDLGACIGPPSKDKQTLKPSCSIDHARQHQLIVIMIRNLISRWLSTGSSASSGTATCQDCEACTIYVYKLKVHNPEGWLSRGKLLFGTEWDEQAATPQQAALLRKAHVLWRVRMRQVQHTTRGGWAAIHFSRFLSGIKCQTLHGPELEDRFTKWPAELDAACHQLCHICMQTDRAENMDKAQAALQRLTGPRSCTPQPKALQLQLNYHYKHNTERSIDLDVDRVTRARPTIFRSTHVFDEC